MDDTSHDLSEQARRKAEQKAVEAELEEIKSSETSTEVKLVRIARALNIGRYSRHIFLCVGPDCCTLEQGLESWTFLKARLRELGLVNHDVYRTKVGCFRICRGGPICIVYPEGIWYHGATPEVLETIIQEHLIGGRIAQEHAFAANPLSVPDEE